MFWSAWFLFTELRKVEGCDGMSTFRLAHLTNLSERYARNKKACLHFPPHNFGCVYIALNLQLTRSQLWLSKLNSNIWRKWVLGLKVKPSSPKKENNLFSLFVLLSMLSIHTNIYLINWTNKVLISSRQKNVAVQVDSHPLLHGCRQFWSCSPFTCSWEKKLDGVEILAGEPLQQQADPDYDWRGGQRFPVSYWKLLKLTRSPFCCLKLVQAGLTRPLFNSGSSISKSPKLLYLDQLDIIEDACTLKRRDTKGTKGTTTNLATFLCSG